MNKSGGRGRIGKNVGEFDINDARFKMLSEPMIFHSNALV